MSWREFSRRTLPIVIRELALPAALPSERAPLYCPRHGERIGVSCMCADCHNEAWDEVARRYEDERQLRRVQVLTQVEDEEV